MQIEFIDYLEYLTPEYTVQEKGSITALVTKQHSSLLKIEVDGVDIALDRITPKEQSRLLTIAREKYDEEMSISPRNRE